ncbi:putative transposase [Duganella sp. 1411]|uniref:transposase n=1 Tax=Duganella sp. 1411 TaxID=2806572 RepID=UPI001AE3E6BC|nr:transposase [Duganella sp. 1411]MBP1208017.1 putative transposase [Duganella sp. 1411]
MPRRHRLVLPEVPLHIIQRGHDRQPCFLVEDDYRKFLNWLQLQSRASQARIHAYVLMTNHVHLLLSVVDAKSLACLMKSTTQNYAQYFNHRYRRCGAVWQGRYKSCVVQTEDYFLTCQRYIELNPVRAGMVRYPGHYRWSSYRCNAEGRDDGIVTPHLLYQRLGVSPAARRLAYLRLIGEPMADDVAIARIRSAINAERTL